MADGRPPATSSVFLAGVAHASSAQGLWGSHLPHAGATSCPWTEVNVVELIRLSCWLKLFVPLKNIPSLGRGRDAVALYSLRKLGVSPPPSGLGTHSTLILGTVCVERQVRSQLVGPPFSRGPSAPRGSGSSPQSRVGLWLGSRSCAMCLSLQTSLADQAATPASSPGTGWGRALPGPVSPRTFQSQLVTVPTDTETSPPGVRRGPAPPQCGTVHRGQDSSPLTSAP